MGWLGSPLRWLRKQEEKQKEKYCFAPQPRWKRQWEEELERERLREAQRQRQHEEMTRWMVEERSLLGSGPGELKPGELIHDGDIRLIERQVRSDVHVEMDMDTMQRRIAARDPETGEWVQWVPKVEQDERARVPAMSLPISWLKEAAERGEQSDIYIRVEVEASGVTVFGQSGDDYATRVIGWEELDTAMLNPVIALIEQVEHHMATLGRVKERTGHG